MSKTLKRLLVILIVLIGIIFVLPKLEHAVDINVGVIQIGRAKFRFHFLLR